MDEVLSFGEHLEVMRRMLFRILGIVAVLMVVVFCFKDATFSLLLAPTSNDFCTYRWIEQLMAALGSDFHFGSFEVDLIATDLSSQFMNHITTSACLALLVASPYIIYELFKFVSPALYKNEKEYSRKIVTVVYLLFVLGVLMTYFVLFPFSFRFLGTYQVSEVVRSTITLDSYISTFISLTLTMALVFQLPVVTYLMAKMGLVDAGMLKKYRRHALVAIMIVAAIITPPDLMSLILVTVPMYMLFEISIWIIRKV